MNDDRIYLVCDACGYFYGDALLLELAPVCEECGEQRAWAFPTIEPALLHSETIKAKLAEVKW